ncbi:MAG: glycosyltransferase family 4 protein, partial [Bacteriovoracaceae bacterium]|nr:glycosyltransferase family 4 protein [Bacteriovoracaceae bacterium]
VTQNALQKRYPPVESIKTIHASSIKLNEDFFFHDKVFNNYSMDWVFVGTLEQFQKAPDVLLKAFRLVVNKFPKAKLSFIGDGRERAGLEKMSKNLGLEKNVNFQGKVSSPEQVREHLIHSPFFVLPSRGEGLPRAMIEAMACGCVCVGSEIGGIQELIEQDWIAKVNDHKDLANKMIKAMDVGSAKQKEISVRNIEEAKAYLSPLLDARRSSLYTALKEHMEKVG